MKEQERPKESFLAKAFWKGTMFICGKIFNFFHRQIMELAKDDWQVDEKSVSNE